MYTVQDLIQYANETEVEIDGKWVPARPMPYFGLGGFLQRAKDAWLVLTGKADAIKWPEGQ